ncbi:nitroreductase family deazaflavin-dependent oxidoreductase [Streptantibioticus ferralitis]|uniref:Nitroreductase family deazaflavin-dependent oxidoreductase n=1 Tax=Streptantibioticus ferralitis TaxID=236510 RepID=A0ABT5YZX4_9ACTN|nr:nitroreductase family deazaflavin-dependent oxidoreductase [Streptantibioticus ferralitis]MDF2256335.1 nitroreductase family deazaflavin-dependent oxidoreductase [Streptantibioticus ferralitis]
MAEQRYLKPGRIEVRLLHNTVGWLTRHGVSVAGSRELAVRGRKSGEWRRNPVNPLTVGSERFLVAPRGHTQWVRNLRAAGDGQLRVGKRIEQFTAVEVPDAEKPALLRAYLSRWKWEVGAFFDGVGPDSSDGELLRIAPDHPVFRITEHN